MSLTIDFSNRRGKVQRMETMGRRVRALRKAASLTQVGLAKTIGIDQSTLSDIERDQNDTFAGKVLLRMSEALGRSPFFIVYGVDVDLKDLTEDEAELLLAFRSSGQEQRKALLTMARALAVKPPNNQ